MNPTQNRQPKGLPVGGQFAASQRDEASAVTLTASPTITLPNGLTHSPGQTPDPEIGVRVKDLGDGTALVSYATSTPFDVGDDQIGAARHLLREIRSAEAVFSGDEFSAKAVDDYLQASGDSHLDRVAFIRRTGPGTYAADSHAPTMQDWDSFKDFASNYDGAVVLPRRCVDEYDAAGIDPVSGATLRNYSMLADDIAEVGSGKVYSLVHEQVRLLDGTIIGSAEDEYDDTIHDVDEADSRLDSQHRDHEWTLEGMD